MRPVTVATTITAPREAVYDFLADLSLRSNFCDHWLAEYRLARVNPRGEGAAARFRVSLPLADEWAEVSITTAERPRRIVEDGRIGRRGRSRLAIVYELTAEGRGATRVELTVFSEAGALTDRFKHLAATGRTRRKAGKALGRLREIFEEGTAGELSRTRIAGFEAAKAPRFGEQVPTARSVASVDR
jgi:uncharacterized protein YndB with AHSA1/START domain